MGRQAAVLFEGHEHIAAYTDRLAQRALCAAKHLGGLGMAVLFGKFGECDSAHCGVLYVDFTTSMTAGIVISQYRRYWLAEYRR